MRVQITSKYSYRWRLQYCFKNGPLTANDNSAKHRAGNEAAVSTANGKSEFENGAKLPCLGISNREWPKRNQSNLRLIISHIHVCPGCPSQVLSQSLHYLAGPPVTYGTIKGRKSGNNWSGKNSDNKRAGLIRLHAYNVFLPERPTGYIELHR